MNIVKTGSSMSDDPKQGQHNTPPSPATGDLSGPGDDRITMSVKQFCHETSLSKSTAHKLIREQKIRATRVGTRTLIYVDTVKALLAPSSEVGMG